MGEIDWRKVKKGDKLTLTAEVADASPHSGTGVIVRFTSGISATAPREDATSWTPAPRPICEGDHVLFKRYIDTYEVVAVRNTHVWITLADTNFEGFVTEVENLKHKD